MPSSSIPCILFLLLTPSIFTELVFSHAEEGSAAVAAEEMAPLAEVVPELWFQVFNGTRRQLGSFQICALCTCCGGPRGLCLSSSCCYVINCNLPNKPFGFCAFTPKACNCFGCHL